MRRSPPLRLLLIGLALLGQPLAAQDITGNAEGMVFGPDGTPLAGAEIIITGTGLPQARMARTDRRGHFRIEAVPVGQYQLHYRAIGFRPVVVPAMAIRLGRTTAAPTIQLESMVIEVASLEVTGERPLIDPASAAGGGNLYADRLDALPVERSYQTLPALLPGINNEVAGLNVNGGTGLENQFFVDGANVTDYNTGVRSTLLPPDFIQEVQVRSGGYEAEYRGALGGNINVVTKSGGNTFQGQLFGYTASDALTGTPRGVAGNTALGNFVRYDGGGSLGGPIRRDRAWFFAAYDRSHDAHDKSIPGFGIHHDEISRSSFAAKVTWQPTDRTTIVSSLLGDPSTHNTVGDANGGILNPDGLLGLQKEGGTSFSTQVTSGLSDRILLRLTGALVRQRAAFQGATALGVAEPAYYDSMGVQSGGVGEQRDFQLTRVSLGGSLSLSAGAHQFKTGLEYASHSLAVDWHSAQIDQDSDTLWYLTQFDQDGTISNRVPSVYLQDSWAVTGRFRLNAGLRWDGQYLYGSDGKRSLTIADQWQPRLGFVLLLDQRGDSRLFGSYGRFYQDLHGSLGGLYHAYGSVVSFRDCPADPRVDSTGCTLPSDPFTHQPAPDLQGQSYDEYAIGLERALSRRFKGTARVVRRRLGWGIEDARVEVAPGDSTWAYGNPGRGALSGYPRMRRDYTALELGVEGQPTDRLWMMASYVWSRTYGNHSGLYNSDEGYIFPNVNGAYDVPEILVNSTGRLGNDRPHVLKLNGSYRFPHGLSTGTSLVWQSGLPLNEYGRISGRQDFFHAFLVPRGTAGRTPATWDLSVRAAWAMGDVLRTKARPTLLFDIYHVGSPRRVLAVDQVHYKDVDGTGTQINPNPSYGEPLEFQPPMAARLGLTVEF